MRWKPAVHELGGAGPLALFGHAAGLHGRVWAPIADRLADRVRAVAVDLRGHGDTPAGRGPVSWQWFADDVRVAASDLGGPLIGVGHSFGATSMLIAEHDRPGTFAGLVLYEPALVDRVDEADEQRRALMVRSTRRRRVRFADLDEAREHATAKPPTNVLHPQALDAYLAHGFTTEPDGSVVSKCQPELEAGVYATASPKLWPYVRPMGCPVTLVVGGESDPRHQRTTRWAADRMGAMLRVLPDVGHFGPLQAPDRFAELLRAELDGPESVSRAQPGRFRGA